MLILLSILLLILFIILTIIPSAIDTKVYIRRLILRSQSRLCGIKHIVFLNDPESYNCLLAKSPAIYEVNLWPIISSEFSSETFAQQIAIIKNISKYKLHELSCKYSINLIEPIQFKDISILPVLIFYEAIFGYPLPHEHYYLFHEASTQLKKKFLSNQACDKHSVNCNKHLANCGDKDIESKIMNLIIEAMDDCDCSEIKLATNNQHVLAAIIRNIFILPMINYGDIFISLYKYKHLFYYIQNEEEIIAFIMETVRLNPIYPILKYCIHDVTCADKSDTDIYVELDQMKQDKQFDLAKWMLDKKYTTPIIKNIYENQVCFGIYIDTDIALTLLVPIFTELISRTHVYPTNGYIYNRSIFSRLFLS